MRAGSRAKTCSTNWNFSIRILYYFCSLILKVQYIHTCTNTVHVHKHSVVLTSRLAAYWQSHWQATGCLWLRITQFSCRTKSQVCLTRLIIRAFLEWILQTSYDRNLVRMAPSCWDNGNCCGMSHSMHATWQACPTSCPQQSIILPAETVGLRKHLSTLFLRSCDRAS